MIMCTVCTRLLQRGQRCICIRNASDGSFDEGVSRKGWGWWEGCGSIAEEKQLAGVGGWKEARIDQELLIFVIRIGGAPALEQYYQGAWDALGCFMVVVNPSVVGSTASL
jgi:hypothetical protein